MSAEDKARIVQAIRDQLPPFGLAERTDYKVRMEIYGRYRRADGKRRRKDRLNVAYRLANLIADAAGIDDSAFGNEEPNSLTITGGESDREYVVVEIE